MIDLKNIEAAIAAVARNDKKDLSEYEAYPSHTYTDSQGKMIYVKSRYKHPATGDKWIRSFHFDEAGKLLYGEPDFNKAYPEGGGKKPLYQLPDLLQADSEPVYFFEGEQKAELAKQLGFIGTTTGGASTVDKHYLEPVRGRRVYLWADHDEAGAKWLLSLYPPLKALDCEISVINTSELGIPEKGDIVDWVKLQHKDGEDDGGINLLIKKLPTYEDEQLGKLLNDDKSNVPNSIIAVEPVFEHENGVFEYVQKTNGTELYFNTYKDDGDLKRAIWVCSKIEVLARSRDTNGKSWGILLEWLDYDGKTHKCAMPAESLRDSSEYQKQLLNEGLRLNNDALKKLDAFFINHPTDKRVRCVNKVGWHHDSYVLPERTFGKDKDSIVYQPEYHAENVYTQKGTLEQWRSELCKPLVEQTRIAFAVSVGFSGQLLELLGHKGAIFHIIGGSTMGKSIGMNVAGSIWGNPEKFCDTWRSTDNGLEAKAVSRNDCIICLDEINQGNPKSVAQSTYMLINGKAKTRAKASGGNRADPEWRLMGLSNGEKTLPTYLKEAGITVNAGQLVRLIHIDADAGKGYKSFDSIVMGNSGAEQASIITSLYQQYHGTAGIAWLEYLAQDKQAHTVTASNLMQGFINQYSGLSEQSGRVLASFAIVAAAGEMATSAGITGWQEGQATNAAKVCFQSYLDNYGSSANHEDKQIIDHIALYLEKYGGSRFQRVEDNVQLMSERAGYYRASDNLYLFGENSFKQECLPFDLKMVVNVLKKYDLLKTNSGSNKLKVNNANVDIERAYAIKGEIINFQI
ncbi:DUF927 domain-containing protein [uncultured Psychrobacter sp.]|uniref:DUF927 domain-containing protein n=1 Tax=uncultured Psychrobacter sp. TaxID=259303 RepID=UPI002598519F|nr:DUF927 domain-containing protein [uncultured Psychrobacter sp.]